MSLFTTELVLDTKALIYDPSEDNFQVSIQIVNSCLFLNHSCIVKVQSVGYLFRRAFQRSLAR